MTHKVFVYGTLKKGWGNHRLLENAKQLDWAVLSPAEFSLYDGGFPYALHEGTDMIKGELYEVDDKTLGHLDQLEGYPSHYNRKQFKFYSGLECNAGEDNGFITAWMYVADSSHTKDYVKKHRKQITKTVNPYVEWGVKHA